jgi:glycosyltransferase involved in cell wall biosynthesis
MCFFIEQGPEKMRILQVHNSYRHLGGEDSVVRAESALLRSHNHEVESYSRNNDDISTMAKIAVAQQTLWSSRTTHDLTNLISKFFPDVIHVHNTVPLISPSLYWAAGQVGVPVVQTLHNFRLMCLNGLFLHEGRVCEDCQGHIPWRGVLKKCYRGSSAASAVLASTISLHRALGTYDNKVMRYIAFNDFCRDKFIEGGLPAERIVIKPNFVDSPAPQDLARNGFLFVGRLSLEKGLDVLVGAVSLLPAVQLRVAGVGPKAAKLDGIAGVTTLGSLVGSAVRDEMNNATALVVPSICYETFGLVVIEAFATGLPVIASRIGALESLVRDNETGLLFEPGNVQDLARKLAWAQAHPDAMAEMGRKARLQYEAEFTAERNYGQLMEIYETSIREQQSAK